MQLGRAVQDITRYGLAQIVYRDGPDGALKLHRLLQVVLRDRMLEQTRSQMRYCAHVLLGNLDPNDPRNVGSWPRYAALLPHAIASDLVNSDDARARSLVDNLVRYLLSVNDYDTAIQLSKSALDARTQRLGPDHPDTQAARLYYQAAKNRTSHIVDTAPSSDQTDGG